MKTINVKWDTDGKDIDLPNEIKIPENIKEDYISDYISDITGFCHFGYNLIN